ncbi:MAG: hypothetical protein WC441_00800 [Patescibacteria group bacterium]
MKKEISLIPLILSLFVVILVVLCVYFGWQVKRQETRINKLQATVVDNNNKVNAIVSFINSSLASTQKK